LIELKILSFLHLLVFFSTIIPCVICIINKRRIGGNIDT
jgi:hypothetical protein